MPNQQLQKLADEASKTYAAWQKQMRRDGFTKREQLSGENADVASMKPAARALFADYQQAQAKLDAEAVNASQPVMPGMEDELDDDKKPDKKPHGLRSVVGGFPDPATVQTPDGMERKIVSPQRLADLRALSAVESIAKAKPMAKVQPLDDMHWVVVGVAENYLVLNRCVPADDWTEPTISDLTGREADDWAGLLFGTGPGKSPKFVLCNAAQSVAVLAGDPLADVSLDESQRAAASSE